MLRTGMISTVCVVAGLLWVSSSFAQAPADAPAGSTGQCKDGTYSSAAHKSGACRGHKGVQSWFATTDAPGSAPAASPAPSAAGAQPTQAAPATTAAPVAPAQPTQSAPKTSPAKGSSFTPPATAAPGGGPGTVWVNKKSKVYHCPNDKWYGKTKDGEYKSEADAKAEGDHPDHGKPCT
jgi:Protein of unknown function (DUF3761)